MYNFLGFKSIEAKANTLSTLIMNNSENFMYAYASINLIDKKNVAKNNAHKGSDCGYIRKKRKYSN